MRRHYAQTVTLVDGSSVWSHSGFDPTPPAQTRIQAPNQPNEPERIETPAETLPGPGTPGQSVDGAL